MIISQDAGKIAALNDALRTTLDRRAGQVMLTQGVTSLGNAFVQAALAEVKAFIVFIEDNDPYGEHDFSSFVIDGRKLFFKLDYYDKDMRFGSEDPSDPSKTARVLTLMLAEEYWAMLDNRKRMYALQSWTVEKKAKGWFIRRTDHDESSRGPYSSATSACLTIARQLKRELIKRDGLPS
jgi:hypothetical protein